MRIIVIVRAAAAALVLGALVAGCHDPISVDPTSPTAPTIASVEIGGPASVAPGQSVQLVANVRMSDGTVKPGTSGVEVKWHLVDLGLVQLSPTGVVTAGTGRGEATISVDVRIGTPVRHASRQMMVLPDGTFRVVGTVKEADAPNPPVVGARVEVAGGDPSTVTDSAGQYRLYGVPANADIHVTGAGYATQVQHVTISTHATENFQLQLDGTRLAITGNFTLAIDVTDNCPGSNPLPGGLRHRTYDASVSQAGSSLDVVLTEPRFRLNSISRGNRFSGRALGGGASFTLDWYDASYYPYYGPSGYPTIAEQLSDGTYLVASGVVTASGTASGLAGTFTGALMQFDSRFPANGPRLLTSCGGTLGFALTAR